MIIAERRRESVRVCFTMMWPKGIQGVEEIVRTVISNLREREREREREDMRRMSIKRGHEIELLLVLRNTIHCQYSVVRLN